MDSQFSQPHTTITTPKLSVMDAFVELLWERPVLVITLWLSLFTVLFVCSWFLGIVPPLETDEGEDAELITEVTAAAIVEDTPVRIVIDAIGVDTKINNPKSTSIEAMDAALLSGVVHYPGSGDLEDHTNMFLFGHSTGFRVVQNDAFKAFNHLDTLVANDLIRVQSNSQEYLYRVTSVKETKAGEAFVEISNREKKLTLSTCDSFGSKEDRFVVEADFIGSYPIRADLD